MFQIKIERTCILYKSNTFHMFVVLLYTTVKWITRKQDICVNSLEYVINTNWSQFIANVKRLPLTQIPS